MDSVNFIRNLSERFCQRSKGGLAIRRVLLYLPPHAAALIAANVCMLIGTASGLAMPYMMGKFFDASLLKGGIAELRFIVLIYFLTSVVSILSNYAQGFLVGRTSCRILRKLRCDVYSHLLNLDVAYYETRQPGELLSRLNSDLTLVQSYVVGIVPTLISGGIQLLGALVILCWIQPKLALLDLLVLFPPIILCTRATGRFRRFLSLQQQDMQAYSSSLAEEAFNGVRTMKALGRERYEAARYEEGLDRLLSLQMRGLRIGNAFDSLSSFIMSIGVLVFLWYGGKLMLDNALSPGQMASFIIYGMSIYRGVSSLIGLYVGFQNALGAGARVFEILDAPYRRRPTHDETKVYPRLGGKICFENVSFKYPHGGGRLALDAISFDVEPGETVGIVGPSGAGKSTLFLLLMGFYDATSGSISIDGHGISEISSQQLRQNVGVVPQDIFLFSGTVEENIRYGRLDASPDEIRAAAMGAGAHEFIERFPNGYAEVVGPRGIKLSAGQRQRIAIARAFLMNPTILLLDEATSSLDPDSEELVRQALTSLIRNRTTLVIAHRLATARRADRILVVDKGTIVTAGTHEYLHATNPLYRRYWELQVFARESLSEQRFPERHQHSRG